MHLFTYFLLSTRGGFFGINLLTAYPIKTRMFEGYPLVSLYVDNPFFSLVGFTGKRFIQQFVFVELVQPYSTDLAGILKVLVNTSSTT